MPFNKIVSAEDPMIKVANEVNSMLKQMKSIEVAVGPKKKELTEHFKEALLKDIFKVKAEVPTVFKLETTATQTIDGVDVQVPTGELIQVQCKVTRQTVTTTAADEVFKAVDQETYDKLIKEEIVLTKAPLMDSLRYALEHPEFCTISASGTSATITVTGVDKLPGITTEVALISTEGFLDTIRDIPADVRKAIKGFITGILDKGLGMAVATGTTAKGGK